MKRTKVCIAVVMALLISLEGCGQGSGRFRVLDTMSNEEFVVGFRKDDRLGVYAEAGLQVLAARGKLTELSLKWFGKDITLLDGDENALDEYKDKIPEREFIVGYDEGAPPVSFRSEEGNLTGFDIELAGELCTLLGWSIKLLDINPANVIVELSSGNIDCAWGGMSFSPEQLSEIDISSPYLKNRKELVTISGSGVMTKGGLRRKEVGMTYDFASLEALEGDPISEKISSYTQYKSTEDCIKALEEGVCQGIIIDSLAVEYYANRYGN